MAKRISELPPTSFLTSDDIMEVAVVDGSSDTGYSSRHVRVGDLPAGSGGNGLCRFNIGNNYPINENQFTISLSFDELAPCLMGYPFNQLSTASLHIQFTAFHESTYTVLGSVIADIIVNQSTYDTMRYIGSNEKSNTSPDILPYTTSAPAIDNAVTIFDVYQYDFGEEGGRGIQIIVNINSEIGYGGIDASVVGFVDFTGAGYNPA